MFKIINNKNLNTNTPKNIFNSVDLEEISDEIATSQLIELTEITDKESVNISGGFLALIVGELLFEAYPAANFYGEAVELIDTLTALNEQFLEGEKPRKIYVNPSASGEDISSHRRLSGTGRYL